MATAATLFSAGKDSALAATLLDPFYDVVLCSCTFGIEPDPSVSGTGASVVETARDAAAALDLPLEPVELDPDVAREAVARMVDDGYPSEGIQQVHEHALDAVAARRTVADREFAVVADGTRRDDRAPSVDRPFAQSLEDRHGIDYVRPLGGYGRGAIDDLVARTLTVETGPSEELATADYETELRALMAAEHGRGVVADVFPAHTQSRVVERQGHVPGRE